MNSDDMPGSLRTPFGKARQVSTTVFIDKVLPALRSDIDFEALAQDALVNGRSKLPVTKSDRLWGYSTRKPSQIKGHKASPFKSLQLCARRISRAVGDLKSIFEFRNNDKASWYLGKREVDSLPDAYILVDSSPDRPVEWSSIAISGVYRKLDTADDAEANITKITRCMSQCMQCDDRRFTYGFTIEDSTMKLWYCDRARVIASDPFDFTRDWRTLFRFLLSVMFAERYALGFDPTMRLSKQDDGTVQYEITVRSQSGEEHLYRTLEVLSESSATHLVGRGTRVWKAIRIEDGQEVGDPVVLKDTWVDDHREREGSINYRIRAASVSSGLEDAIAKSLLTVMCHGDLFVAGSQDRTLSLQDDEVPVPTYITIENRRVPGTPQVHYRIVYKEIGTPLSEATSLAVVFEALRDVVYGLMAIHTCGWVHGDISFGNILLYGDCAKIADLEYAVQKDERKEHDRIGTNSFIAVEVKDHLYHFRPAVEVKRSPGQHVMFDDYAAWKENEAKRGKPRSPQRPSSEDDQPPIVFRYNPLHDLESLWWIAAYFVICYQVVDEKEGEHSAQSSDNATLQRKYASELFWTRGYRTLAITQRDYFPRVIRSLHPSVRKIGSFLDMLRVEMFMTYRDAEEHIGAIGFDIAGDLHSMFARHFSSFVKALRKQDVTVRSLRVDGESRDSVTS